MISSDAQWRRLKRCSSSSDRTCDSTSHGQPHRASTIPSALTTSYPQVTSGCSKPVRNSLTGRCFSTRYLVFLFFRYMKQISMPSQLVTGTEPKGGFFCIHKKRRILLKNRKSWVLCGYKFFPISGKIFSVCPHTCIIYILRNIRSVCWLYRRWRGGGIEVSYAHLIIIRCTGNIPELCVYSIRGEITSTKSKYMSARTLTQDSRLHYTYELNSIFFNSVDSTEAISFRKFF